jgi:hypothetical protein
MDDSFQLVLYGAGVSVLVGFLTHGLIAHWLWERITKPNQYSFWRLNPYEEGLGHYFVWDFYKRKFRVLHVIDDGINIVIEIPGLKYQPYAGAIPCYWLLKV